MAVRRTVLLALSLSSLAAATLSVCYDETKNQDTEIIPCQPDSTVSGCCTPGDICYSNGLCKPGAGLDDRNLTYYTEYFFNGCTDSSLQDPICAPVFECQSFVDTKGVKTCGNGNYCCYGTSDCDCDDSAAVFSLAAGTTVTSLPVSTATGASTRGSTSTQAETTAIESGSALSAIATPASSASTSATAVSAPSSPSESHSVNTTAIGVGVGVGVGAAIIGALIAWWLIKRRKGKSNRGTYDDTMQHGDAKEVPATAAAWELPAEKHNQWRQPFEMPTHSRPAPVPQEMSAER